MNVFKINPYIRAAKRSVIPAGEEIRQRIIFDYEIIYIEKGEFVLHYDKKDYLCKTGDFLLLRPGISHSFRGICQDLSQPHIHFDMTYSDESVHIPISFKDLPALTAQERGMLQKDVFAAYPVTPYLTFHDKDTALRLFHNITGNTSLSPLARKGMFLLLLDMLIQDNFPGLPGKQTNKHPIENEVKDYIDAGQGLSATLDDIAKQFIYSKYYLERRFKAAFGISLITYRNQKRMQSARESLQQQSVTAVSEKLGFSSVYAFSRAFRKHFGFPPSAAKKP